MTNAKPRILAIDDHPANLYTLGAALGDDFALQIVTSGAAGLALALEIAPDLILLDVMMPEMDGYETCRRLKAEPRLCSIPVVFITALGDTAAESAGLALGAADYMTKPINVDIARQRIRNLLEREALRKEVEAQRDILQELVSACALGLSIAKESASNAHHSKTVFLRNISHELRTPMSGIMGMTELALLRATDPKQADHLGKLKRASTQLLALITSLIDISALEANQLSLEHGQFRLAAVLDKLNGLFAPQAAGKGLGWSIETATALAQLQVLGDAPRLEQILLNLIDNAIKFTARGSVSVAATVAEESAGDVLLRFDVRDTGIGIEPADQRRIFNLFEQGDGSTTRTYGGTGLGLTLCSQLIGLMGGEISVDSKPGAGSLFWFTVRLRKPDDNSP
ncbi:MAG: ATP-binding protein [Rhodocyclales bacterium]|nr:ATP-binding protein [Rhodocyclales bacterium]